MSIEIDRDLEWLPMMNKIIAKLDNIEDKIEAAKSNTELQLKEFDKVLKKVK